MAMPKMETEKFTGMNDFGLWRIKIRAMLTQQGLESALEEDEGSSPSRILAKDGDTKENGTTAAAEAELKKTGIRAKAHNLIILCLGDKVLREVAKEKSAAAVWAKLESIYMTKSLANRLYMKQRLYSFRVVNDKPLEDQLDAFNKILDDLENVDVKVEDEDQAIILLNALPPSYDHLRDAMLYGRENDISVEEVQSALKAEELQKSALLTLKQDNVGEGLSVK